MKISYEKEVIIAIDGLRLMGNLLLPQDAKAIIIFSHGSGSSRFSQRNQGVAKQLQPHGFGTLLLDLLTPEEDKDYQNRFDIALLKERLIAATIWLKKLPAVMNTPIGYFGASTGAASALKAAADLADIFAVVSRGGRPDLAMEDLPRVNAPTLLIVGSLDHQVIKYNQDAYQRLKCEKHLEIVEGASHLFEEPGKLEKVGELALMWFTGHIPAIMA